MSDSIKKWEELEKEREDRQRVVEQNGPSGLHYDIDGILSKTFTKEPTWAHTLSNSNTVDSTNTSIYDSTNSAGVTHGYFDHLLTNSNPVQDLAGVIYGGCPTHHQEEEEEVDSQPDFKKVTDSIADLLKYKNIKYGNSALEPMDIFQGKCKVGQRLDDKLARVKNGGELQKNDIADLIGYLTLVCVENGWNNFDEFKD